MSRFRRIFLLFSLLAAWALPVFAAGDQDAEMVYRASLGRADDVKLLVSQKVSPDVKNDKGVPALALASARKDLEGLNVVQALVEGGANLEAHDTDGQTPLFYAATKGNVPIVNYLLSRGANRGAIDINGNQARIAAYMAGQNDVVAAIDAFAVKEAARAKEKNTQDQLVKENKALREQLEEKSKIVAAPAMTEQATNTAIDMAFNMCAFQYWSYCSDRKQSTELSAQEMESAIASTQEQTESLKIQLARDYGVEPTKINNTLTSAQRRIYLELNGMGSNTQRREQGVGKRGDMVQRCKKISTAWDVPAPALEEKVVPEKIEAPVAAAQPAQPKIRKVADDFLMDARKP